MGHPEIDNQTPFVFEPLLMADEEARPLLVPIVKATFDIEPDGNLMLSEQQIPVSFSGECWGEPGESSYRFEPETAFTKLATDVVLIGEAHAPRPGIRSIEVNFSVGPAAKRLRVTGDRRWVKGLFGPRMTSPEPFETIPLVYERAYGGWDRTQGDPGGQGYEPRNPVGVGFRKKRAKFVEDSPVPNVEDPDHLLKSYTGPSVPGGVGFVCPHWNPRSRLAGTYDDNWSENRAPRLPLDFHRRFFNAASEGLTAPGYLRGDEPVQVSNVTPEGWLAFTLPAVAAPECTVSLRDRGTHVLETALDTVIVDAASRRLLLLWRALMVLSESPTDIRALRISAENAPERVAPPDNVVPISGFAATG